MAARIEPATEEPGVEARPLWRRCVEVLVPPLVALVAGWALIAVRSPYGGWRLLDPLSYARWDSGLYLHIARSGYFAVSCTQHTSQAPPGTYLCGTISWFPGYPIAIRALSTVTGLSLDVAGLVIAWACWYLVLVLMWRLLADARSTSTRWVCLLIAAFFPGQVYFAAMFPISLCVAAILGCLYLALRPYRPALAWAGFAAGFVAGYSYLTAIVLVPALLVTGLLVLRGRSRLQAIIPAAGAAAGFAAVLLTMQAAVGIWNAYFISARRWGVGGRLVADEGKFVVRAVGVQHGAGSGGEREGGGFAEHVTMVLRQDVTVGDAVAGDPGDQVDAGAVGGAETEAGLGHPGGAVARLARRGRVLLGDGAGAAAQQGQVRREVGLFGDQAER